VEEKSDADFAPISRKLQRIALKASVEARAVTDKVKKMIALPLSKTVSDC